MFKKLALTVAMTTALMSQAWACTTIVVDRGATENGAYMIARSVDGHINTPQQIVLHPAVKNQKGMYRTKETGFRGTAFEYPLPETAFAYSSTPTWKPNVKDMQVFNDGASGFNDQGVGLSGTESIFASPEALKADPYNKVNGITEVDVTNVILPRAKTARDGVKILGHIIETIGVGEGIGVAFVDKNELWYLESGSGHQWLARRIPKNQYLASANQGRLQEYDPNSEDYLASPNLVSFAVEHGLYNPQKDGAFNFSKAYIRDDSRDRTYNDPRVWVIQKTFTPSLEQPMQEGRQFPVFATPDKKLVLADLRKMMRNHYQGEEYDPYSNGMTSEMPYRPISVPRAFQTHILEVRPDLPSAIGQIRYLAFGMADLSVFLPIYDGLNTIPEAFTTGTRQADNVSFFWKIRKLQGLVMTDYPALAPMVHEAYEQFEIQTETAQKAFEADYLKMVKKDPAGAQKLLNTFNLKVLADAESLTDSLANKVATEQMKLLLKKYPFKNKKNHD